MSATKHQRRTRVIPVEGTSGWATVGVQPRHGSDDNPAYVIEQEDGTTVLKLQSEVEKV